MRTAASSAAAFGAATTPAFGAAASAPAFGAASTPAFGGGGGFGELIPHAMAYLFAPSWLLRQPGLVFVAVHSAGQAR